MMTRILITILAVLALAGGVSPVAAQEVMEVRIDKLTASRMEDEAVLAYTSVKAGEKLNRAAIARDVKALEKSGRFSYVSTQVQRVPGGVAVIYSVKGKPRIRRLEINGADELGNKKVRDLMELGVGDLVDDAILGTKLQKVTEKYRDEYFPFVDVDWTIKEDEGEGTADVKVMVKEGRRANVQEITFTGQEVISERKLRKIMKQKRHNFWLSWITGAGTYKPDDLETDVDALRRAMMDEGYLDARVSAPEIHPTGKKGMNVHFNIEAGKRYRIGQLNLEGESLFPEAQIRAVVTNKPNDLASLSAIEGAQQAVRDYYGSRGYIRSDVVYEWKPDTERGVVDLTYQIKEGKQSYIRNVLIRGNVRTKDKVIRRELTVYPGEIYNQVKVRNSERRLRNMGYFSFVNAVPEDTPDAEKHDVVFELEEQKTGQFLVGMGFSSVDDLIGFAELSQGNFNLGTWPPTGGGQKLKLRGTAGTKRNDIELSFVEPWFLDRKLSLGIDLYQHERRFLSDEYDQRNTGGAITLGKPLTSFTRANLIYGLEEIEVYDVAEDASETIKAEEGTQLKSSVTLELVRDSRDSSFVATRGNRSKLSGMIAGGPLGGDTQVYNLEAQSTQYWPVWFDHVFNLRGWISVAEEWGDGDRVPIFDRLFLGGARTLRGFKYREVGPKDEDGEPIGGLSGWYGIAEYSIPLAEKFRVAGFYDLGMVYDEAYEFEWGEYNSDVGLGLRVDFPGFPIRLDYAWPLETDEFNDRSGGRFQFWIGYGY